MLSSKWPDGISLARRAMAARHIGLVERHSFFPPGNAEISGLLPGYAPMYLCTGASMHQCICVSMYLCVNVPAYLCISVSTGAGLLESQSLGGVIGRLMASRCSTRWVGDHYSFIQSIPAPVSAPCGPVPPAPPAHSCSARAPIQLGYIGQGFGLRCSARSSLLRRGVCGATQDRRGHVPDQIAPPPVLLEPELELAQDRAAVLGVWAMGVT